ncbi:unnamed protein product [Caenorhabditis bovis]|uniref:Uncharacterized protein n=1 Tax=Caenorhabditis bovis TaxID=2654633 RepID=A0A8S1FCQ7_9PELO|nr:unnamed protein product [Caenorhabditis bovis]
MNSPPLACRSKEEAVDSHNIDVASITSVDGQPTPPIEGNQVTYKFSSIFSGLPPSNGQNYIQRLAAITESDSEEEEDMVMTPNDAKMPKLGEKQSNNFPLLSLSDTKSVKKRERKSSSKAKNAVKQEPSTSNTSSDSVAQLSAGVKTKSRRVSRPTQRKRENIEYISEQKRSTRTRKAKTGSAQTLAVQTDTNSTDTAHAQTNFSHVNEPRGTQNQASQAQAKHAQEDQAQPTQAQDTHNQATLTQTSESQATQNQATQDQAVMTHVPQDQTAQAQSHETQKSAVRATQDETAQEQTTEAQATQDHTMMNQVTQDPTTQAQATINSATQLHATQVHQGQSQSDRGSCKIFQTPSFDSFRDSRTYMRSPAPLTYHYQVRAPFSSYQPSNDYIPPFSSCQTALNDQQLFLTNGFTQSPVLRPQSLACHSRHNGFDSDIYTARSMKKQQSIWYNPKTNAGEPSLFASTYYEHDPCICPRPEYGQHFPGIFATPPVPIEYFENYATPAKRARFESNSAMKAEAYTSPTMTDYYSPPATNYPVVYNMPTSIRSATPNNGFPSPIQYVGSLPSVYSFKNGALEFTDDYVTPKEALPVPGPNDPLPSIETIFSKSANGSALKQHSDDSSSFLF